MNNEPPLYFAVDFARMEVTEEFPFLVTPFDPYVEH